MKSFSTLVGKTTRAAIANDRQIKQVISRIVPASTLSHIEFCRLEGGRVRITVDSAAWVSRLRFSERQLIDALRSQRFDVHTASYHVAPDETPALRKTVRAPQKKTQTGAASVEAAALAMAQSATAQSDVEKTGMSESGAVKSGVINSGVIKSGNDDRLRQELLKLASTLRAK